MLAGLDRARGVIVAAVECSEGREWISHGHDFVEASLRSRIPHGRRRTLAARIVVEIYVALNALLIFEIASEMVRV